MFDQTRLARAVAHHTVKAKVVAGRAAHAHNHLASGVRGGVGHGAFAQQTVQRHRAAIQVQCAAAVELHIRGGGDLGVAGAANAQRAAVAHFDRWHRQTAPQGVDGGVVVGLVQQQHAGFDHRASTVADRATQGQGAGAFLEQLAIAVHMESARPGGAERACECGVGVVATDSEDGCAERQGAGAREGTHPLVEAIGADAGVVGNKQAGVDRIAAVAQQWAHGVMRAQAQGALHHPRLAGVRVLPTERESAGARLDQLAQARDHAAKGGAAVVAAHIERATGAAEHHLGACRGAGQRRQRLCASIEVKHCAAVDGQRRRVAQGLIGTHQQGSLVECGVAAVGAAARQRQGAAAVFDQAATGAGNFATKSGAGVVAAHTQTGGAQLDAAGAGDRSQVLSGVAGVKHRARHHRHRAGRGHRHRCVELESASLHHGGAGVSAGAPQHQFTAARFGQATAAVDAAHHAAVRHGFAADHIDAATALHLNAASGGQRQTFGETQGGPVADHHPIDHCGGRAQLAVGAHRQGATVHNGFAGVGVVAGQNQLAGTGFHKVARTTEAAAEGQRRSLGHFNAAEQRVKGRNGQRIATPVPDVGAVQINLSQRHTPVHIGGHSAQCIHQPASRQIRGVGVEHRVAVHPRHRQVQGAAGHRGAGCHTLGQLHRHPQRLAVVGDAC